MCPHKFKRGRVANPGNHAPSGTPNPDEPSAYGGGKGGSRGAKPPWQGVWGMCPHEFKRGGESSTLATTPRVGPKTLANPQPTGVGKGGPGGRSPQAGGLGDVPPQNLIRGRAAHPWQPRHEWDPKPWRTLSLRGWERGSRGAKPPWQGVWGMCPHKFKRGRVANPGNHATSGT